MGNSAIFIVLLKMYISEHANIFRLVIIIPLLTHSPNDKFFLKVICSLQFPSSPVNIQYPVKEYIFVTGMTQTDPPTFLVILKQKSVKPELMYKLNIIIIFKKKKYQRNTLSILSILK